MTVGDVNSTERGSGARYNSGKPEMHLLPWFALQGAMQVCRQDPDAVQGELGKLLWHLGEWQRRLHYRSEDHLDYAIAELAWIIAHDEGITAPEDTLPLLSFYGTARVLMYGRQKYAAWNWAKGMAWSICLDCTFRHLAKWQAGEAFDPESNESHLHHAMCNLVFLATYRSTYAEGDDRPVELQPNLTKVAVGHPPCWPDQQQMNEVMRHAVERQFHQMTQGDHVSFEPGGVRFR